MDAERDGRAEEDAGIIDLIALEALGSATVSPNHSSASIQTELPNLNEETHVSGDPAPTDGTRL